MGKASRLKAERAAAREMRPPSVQGTSRDPFEHLYAAVIAIGDAFGTDADCASAAALLRQAGRLIGCDLGWRILVGAVTASSLFSRANSHQAPAIVNILLASGVCSLRRSTQIVSTQNSLLFSSMESIISSGGGLTPPAIDKPMCSSRSPAVPQESSALTRPTGAHHQ